MEVTTGSALLVALGARLLLKSVFIISTEPPSTTDYLLNGLFQGVLLYSSYTQVSVLVIPVGCGIVAKLFSDFSRTLDTTQCICTVLGIALGFIITDMMSRTFEPDTVKERERTTSTSVPREPSKRLRLVSFGRSQERTRAHRRESGRTHRRDADERDRERERERERERDRNPRRLEVRPITPALTYASTAPSISLDSVPSSIDPDGRMTPEERAIAVLRARASLADSERRRFKEERKWALSQGNYARASQLAWQVRRFTALMESFHREADAKVVKAARAAEPQATAERTRKVSSSSRHKSGQSSVPFPGQTSTSAQPDPTPIVSVTVDTTRSRRRSSGTIKPAIHVQGRDYRRG